MKCQNVKNLFIIIGTLLLSGISTASYAQVPRTVNYQGYLTDSGGNPVDTTLSGPVQMIFTIYDDGTAGTAIIGQ